LGKESVRQKAPHTFGQEENCNARGSCSNRGDETHRLPYEEKYLKKRSSYKKRCAGEQVRGKSDGGLLCAWAKTDKEPAYIVSAHDTESTQWGYSTKGGGK